LFRLTFIPPFSIVPLQANGGLWVVDAGEPLSVPGPTVSMPKSTFRVMFPQRVHAEQGTQQAAAPYYKLVQYGAATDRGDHQQHRFCHRAEGESGQPVAGHDRDGLVKYVPGINRHIGVWEPRERPVQVVVGETEHGNDPDPAVEVGDQQHHVLLRSGRVLRKDRGQ
jgi:hypothetical protein